MALTHAQKKLIKKNIREKPLASIASDINVDEDEILDYLKGLWRKEKYIRYVSANKNENLKSDMPTGGFVAMLKDWLAKEKYIVFGLLILVAIVYANSVNNAFVSDDIGAIQNNPNIGKLNIKIANIRSIVNLVVYYIAYKIGGINPSIYRLFNIAFHAGNVVLVYLLFYKMRSKKLAILTASLFAVHPILIESVTWISGGGYVRYTFFFLLSFFVYIFRPPNIKTLFISGFLFLLAIFSSEKAVPLAVVYPFYDYLFRRKDMKALNFLLYLVISGSYVLVFFRLVRERLSALQTNYYLDTSIYVNPLEQIPIAITKYLQLIFWPSGLTLYHSEMSFSQQEFFLRFLIFLVFIFLILYLYWKLRSKSFSMMIRFWKVVKSSEAYNYKFLDYKFILFWMVFFFVALAVTLTPLQISWIVAERYVYLGSIGIFAVIGLILSKLAKKESLKPYVYIGFTVVIFLLSIRTIIRNRDWKNEDTLWLATAKVSPSSSQNHNNLGDYYGRHGDLERSAQEFQKAIELKPNYADAYHNLANTYSQIAALKLNQKNSNKNKSTTTSEDNSGGNKEEEVKSASEFKKYISLAIENYQKAIKYNPNLWQSYQNLAVIYFNIGDTKKAEEFFLKAIEVSPNNSGLIYNLGMMYIQMQEKEKAKSAFLSVLQIDPENQDAQKMLNQINSN